jgi:hypothetical protein
VRDKSRSQAATHVGLGPARPPRTVEGKVRVAPALARIKYDNPRDARVARLAEKVLGQMLDSLRRKNPR